MSHQKEPSLPGYDVIRERIEAVQNQEIQYALKTTYLFAGRIGEVVGRANLGDTKTTTRGPKGSDAVLDSYLYRERQEPVVVFTVRTAKRDGIERKVALPLAYEPWAKELYSFFQERKTDYVFPFTRQKVWLSSKQVFDNLNYPIEEYRIKRDGSLQSVPRHARPFRLHALRHLRASEIVSYWI